MKYSGCKNKVNFSFFPPYEFNFLPINIVIYSDSIVASCNNFIIYLGRLKP